MSGILYGVGVGPGDPELMTLKAVRMIRENRVMAFPGENPRETVSYKIAVQAVPELACKTLLSIPMPMVTNREVLCQSHRKGADKIERYLKQNQNVVFLTLGDPTIYSTFLYIQKHVLSDGYATELVSGVPSFCAAAARANISLAEWNEPLHIIPAVHQANRSFFDLSGNCIFMKSGSKMAQIKALLRESGRDITMVENCGLPGESIVRNVGEIPDNAGYYTLIIAKENPAHSPKSF